MSSHDHSSHDHAGPGYASPEVARQPPPEQFVYVAALYEEAEGARPHEIHLPGGDCTTEIFQ